MSPYLAKISNYSAFDDRTFRVLSGLTVRQPTKRDGRETRPRWLDMLISLGMFISFAMFISFGMFILLILLAYRRCSTCFSDL